jgi:PadR family transcriptional regulator PadR
MMKRQPGDWLAQVRRGLLELCILALIDKEPTYGYELVTRLARTPQLAAGEGTVYPLLRRLRRDGFLSTQWKESAAGPPRQYYELTGAGREHLGALHRDWAAIVDAVRVNLEPETQQ